MNKEITFTISGTTVGIDRTCVTKMVWDEATGVLELSGLHDELYDAIRHCGIHKNHLDTKGIYEQTKENVGGVSVLKAHCMLRGEAPQEREQHLVGFIDSLVIDRYIAQRDAIRAKAAFGIQNVKAGRVV
ncbi:MAG: hypothetical protein ACK52W_08620 [Alphaproteobacteria bacterium]